MANTLLFASLNHATTVMGIPRESRAARFGIKALVSDGLPPKIQRALDTVRVIGNHAVHPGKLDVNDSRQTVMALFKLVNIIAEKFYTEPRNINDLYNSIPASNIDGIKNRDK
jgi:hypothetical protein